LGPIGKGMMEGDGMEGGLIWYVTDRRGGARGAAVLNFKVPRGTAAQALMEGIYIHLCLNLHFTWAPKAGGRGRGRGRGREKL